ncbi:hypothetical protein Mapa_001272 [Marchantia paleacea]|nr:hypothetical protein Mapa_001272 [Marchantia paleacea]
MDLQTRQKEDARKGEGERARGKLQQERWRWNSRGELLLPEPELVEGQGCGRREAKTFGKGFCGACRRRLQAMDPLDEANKLLGVLRDVKEVCEKKRNNVEVMRELGLFIESLQQAIGVLERRALDRRRARIEDTPNIPHLLSSGTADELVEDLECASDSLQQVLKVPRNSWNIATLIQRLRSVREIVIKSFQTKLQVTAFDLLSDEERRREEEDQRQRQELHKNLLPAHRASKGYPHSVRQNFSSIRVEHPLPGGAGHHLVPHELRSLPRPGLDIVPAQTSRRMEAEDDSFPDELVVHNLKMDTSQMRTTQARPVGTTETEAFFADVLANLEVMRAEQESQRSRPTEDEMSEWFEDPITGEIMSDPIKCTDGRTYDRWTIIDNHLVKCPYDSSMLDFRIAFDDIDVRARLFRAFPEKEQTYRSRRQAHKLKALDHARKGEHREALTKLNQVLQWNSHDEECKAKRDQVMLLLQPSSDSPTASVTPTAPASSSARSLRERIRRCSISSWLWGRRSR